MPLRFSASSAGRLMACPGSANLELAIPGYVPPVVDEMKGAKGVGTNIHDLIYQAGMSLVEVELQDLAAVVREFAELHHTKRKALLADGGERFRWVSLHVPHTTALHRIAFTFLPPVAELSPALMRFYAQALRYLATQMELSQWLQLEVKMTAEWLKSKPGTTADVVARDGKRLIVVDWKTGKIPVDAVDNDQLLFYAATVVDKFDLADVVTEIQMVIVQPGKYAKDPATVSTWTVSIDELKAWARRALRAEDRILDEDLTLKPSKNCTFCPANPQSRGDKGRPYCPAMMQLLYPQDIEADEILAAV